MSGLSLLSPIGLAALVGIPLVVLFHMRHTTPVNRDVPTLRFWRQAMEDQHAHERFRRPPISLLMILQLLAVALIGIALARPAATDALGGFGARTEPTHLILLLDGSTSMGATDTASGRTRYAEAREIAASRLNSLRQGDVATLVLMGTHPITLEATDDAGIRAMSDRVRSTPLPGGLVDLNSTLDLASNLLLLGLSNQVVLVTDGALAVDQSLVAALGAPVSLELVGQASTPNVAITDIETRSSMNESGAEVVFVHVQNFADAPASVEVSITADGFEMASDRIDLDAGDGSDLDYQLPSGTQRVTASIIQSDALEDDNQASTVIARDSTTGRRILLVSDVSSGLQRALAVLPGVTLDVISSVESTDPERTSGYDLVVYEGSPPAGTPPLAPILFVNQPEGGLLSTRGVMANPTAVDIRPGDPLLAEVELGGVTFDQTVVHQLDGTMTEVAGAEAGPLIYRGRVPVTNKPMIVFTFDVAATNMTQRVAFPILVTNAVRELVPNPLPSSVALGEAVVFRPHPGTVAVNFTAPDGRLTQVAVEGAANDQAQASDGGDSRLQDVTFGDTGLPGSYLVAELDGEGDSASTGEFIVNAGHEQESDLRANQTLPGSLALATSTGTIQSRSSLSDFWPLLAMIGLGLLLIEWLVALSPWRRQRRTSLARSGARGGD